MIKNIKSNSSVTLFALPLSVLLLISCVSIDDRKSTSDLQTDTVINNLLGEIQILDPESLVSEGKLTEAAMLYLKIANKATSPERESLQLKGIQLLVKEKSFAKSINLLLKINPAELNTNQLVHYAYLNAKISINARHAEQSVQWINYISDESYLRFTSKIDVLKLFISAYELANNNQSAILNRIQLDPLLAEQWYQSLIPEAEYVTNQQAIIRGLLLLNEDELQAITKIDLTMIKFTMINSTWFDLAMLVKKSKNPFRLGSQLTSWQELNPENTVHPEIIAALAPQQSVEQINIENIALLLPLSGPFKKPASAIRDGFLATYYAEDTLENKPTIRIYDSSSKTMTITEIYQRALDEGANIIVGPLRKSAIRILAESGNIQTPTLVLNQLEDSTFYTQNLYQFALSPEQEARQVAQRAWSDGHSRAAIIYPRNKWGKRVLTAFKDEWEELGGDIVAENDYNTKKNDFSKPIKTLLSIDKSRDRKRKLAKLLRTKLRFDIRRRQDIDFVFMAAFPRQARLIPPQLKFFHAGNLPIYSTSHSFSGKINHKKDRDLDKLIIGDMPWTLTTTKNNNTKQQIYRIWPNKSKQVNRFYAFGSDSYYILPYLNWLRSNSQSRIEGQTGNLHMNESNQILRDLTWAKFKKGRPQLLPAMAKIE